MELMHLKYFQNVAKTEHMTKSSKDLNIVQPALSRSIHNLENELGVKLFDRSGRVIKLNDNGRHFLKTVDEVLMLLENSKKKLLDMNDKSNNEIKLLVLAGSNTVINLILSFRKLYPDTTFKLLQNSNSSENDFDYDFCISSTLHKDESINSTILIEEELFIGVSNTNPLSKKDSVYLKEVKNENFISFESGKPFRQISDELCKEAGFKPNIAFESDLPKIVKDLIVSGVGISFIPAYTWDISSDDSLKLLHIIDPVCKRYLNLYSNPNTHITSRAKIFRNFVVNYYSTIGL